MDEVSIGELSSLGWNDRVAALFNGLAGPLDEPARVVRVERSQSVVVSTDGRDQFVATLTQAVVGDWVAVRGGAIHAVLPRWSALSRMDPNGVNIQFLATNVDLVIVTAPADRLNANRVERELAIAWASGALPIVVLTKADVAPPNTQRDLQSRLVGVEVLATSAVTRAGVDKLAAELRPDRTAVLLGPSGAGKSTLANALLGVDRLAIGTVRDGDHRGRHTTTSRQLVVLPSGGILIDTPGLRSLSLAGNVVEQVFPEIEALARNCRFKDCHHETEPGCAVNAARTSGQLNADRLANFRKLQSELAAQARRQELFLRKAEIEKRRSRVIAKAYDKHRPR
jgi:ribosome biogenesis GTPase